MSYLLVRVALNFFIYEFIHLKSSSFHRKEESPLPDGTYPISLSQATQERFECVAEWDLSILEPQKIVQLEKIKEDLKKQDSDFAPLKDHIRVSSNLLYIL